jgi:hypothetical protein
VRVTSMVEQVVELGIGDARLDEIQIRHIAADGHQAYEQFASGLARDAGGICSRRACDRFANNETNECVSEIVQIRDPPGNDAGFDA